jgi:hypothetical protein
MRLVAYQDDLRSAPLPRGSRPQSRASLVAENEMLRQELIAASDATLFTKNVPRRTPFDRTLVGGRTWPHSSPESGKAQAGRPLEAV